MAFINNIDKIWKIFDIPSPLTSLLHTLMLIFGYPLTPSPLHVNVVYGYPLTRSYRLWATKIFSIISIIDTFFRRIQFSVWNQNLFSLHTRLSEVVPSFPSMGGRNKVYEYWRFFTLILIAFPFQKNTPSYVVNFLCSKLSTFMKSSWVFVDE